LLIANQAPNIKICIIVVLLATSDQNNPSLSTARVPLGKNQGKIQKCILGLLVARRNNYRPRKRAANLHILVNICYISYVCKWFYQAWSGRSAGF
jgi:hypothetical protein